MFNITYLREGQRKRLYYIFIYLLHIASLDKCMILLAHLKAYLVLLRNADLLQGIQDLEV